MQKIWGNTLLLYLYKILQFYYIFVTIVTPMFKGQNRNYIQTYLNLSYIIKFGG